MKPIRNQRYMFSRRSSRLEVGLRLTRFWVHSLKCPESFQFTISVTVVACRKPPDAPVTVNGLCTRGGAPSFHCALGENEQFEEAGSPEQLRCLAETKAMAEREGLTAHR